ncbi:MAG: phosphoribosylaminoimidazolesuccinocarboxamide synthase [Euryarchaeota archaeon]|nr:phosphoribosylaminoimidazolesuccinocarboxamide synthase [Euryarchaeota archaeon]
MGRPVGRPVVLQTDLPFPKRQGKVRDIYEVDDRLLLVASDRISAFDVVLPNGIPDKGATLTQISNFWFDKMADLVPNHLIATQVDDYPAALQEHREVLADRSVLVEKARPLGVECVVRGYIIGSGWKDYQKTGKVCGIELPKGLRQAEALPEAIFTPATKAELGAHDENITFEEACAIEGAEIMEEARRISLAIYGRAHTFARERGIILADTKFEFGRRPDGTLVLIDECLTPDSSRFWPAEEYAVGISPPSFDKQYVRDHLETLDWDKTPPGPVLPDEVVEGTSARYKEAFKRLTGKDLETVLE